MITLNTIDWTDTKNMGTITHLEKPLTLTELDELELMEKMLEEIQDIDCEIYSD